MAFLFSGEKYRHLNDDDDRSYLFARNQVPIVSHSYGVYFKRLRNACASDGQSSRRNFASDDRSARRCQDAPAHARVGILQRALSSCF